MSLLYIIANNTPLLNQSMIRQSMGICLGISRFHIPVYLFVWLECRLHDSPPCFSVLLNLRRTCSMVNIYGLFVCHYLYLYTTVL